MNNNIMHRILLMCLILVGVGCEKAGKGHAGKGHAGKGHPYLEMDHESVDEQLNSYFLGEDIYEIRDRFVKKGFYVSSIVDTTGSKTRLTMSVQIRPLEDSFVRDFAYTTGVDLKPWKERKPSHLRVRADMEGKIYEVELR